jgi:dTDP-4-dehydrorhamnose reductase
LRIWVTGGSGLLGQALVPVLQQRGHDVCAPARSECDVTRPAAITRSLDRFRPDAIIHLAAYTAVDRAESEADQAQAVNAEATQTLARESTRRGIHLTYVSTDYVFGGRTAEAATTIATAPILADTPRAPLGVYGRTKAAGEEAIETSGGDHLIVRTSWLYGAGGRNFVDTMFGLFREGKVLRIPDDQRGRPTWTSTLAQALADLVQDGVTGIHHVTDAGEATWYALATAVAELAGFEPDLSPRATAEHPTPAPRPPYSVLALEGTEAVLGRALPQWKESLRNYLAETGRLAVT